MGNRVAHGSRTEKFGAGASGKPHGEKKQPRHPKPTSGLLPDHPPLLLGAGGMLHRAWGNLLDDWELPRRDFGRKELDFTQPQTIDKALPDDCRLIVNCAAYTNVDLAEQDEPTATAVNGTGVGRLAECCRERGIFLVHYSTDYVFDGKSNHPYRTDHPVEPLGAYGRSKALGEKLIRDSGCRHLILRTSWLYAPWGKNFVRTIAGLVKRNQPLRIVDDQRGRPTSSENLAWATTRLIDAGAEGTYHVTDGGDCTWFDFAREIGRILGGTSPIDPCATAELARPAPRPAYSVMDLSETEKRIGPMPAWQAALGDVLRRSE